MGLTSGPVVNVVFKKRHDRLYSGYFNAMNAVNVGYGNNQADLTYADSLNQVKLNYYVGYRDINNQERTEDFVYNPQFHSHYAGIGHMKGQYHRINASYQRFQGRHLFNAKVIAELSPGKETEERTGQIFSDREQYQGVGESSLQNRSNTVALDLYYQYFMKKNRVLAFNVVNTLGDAYSESAQYLQSDAPAGSPYDYRVHSRFDNDSYSGIAAARFMSPLWGGNFSISSRYEYKRLAQRTTAGKTIPETHTAMVYAGWSTYWKGCTFYPALGATVVDREASGISRTSATPYIRLYADWWGTKFLKGATAQLTLTHRVSAPSLGDVTEGVTYLDPWLLSSGNPELKNYSTTSGKFVLGYYPSGSKNRVAFFALPSYSNHPFVRTLAKAADGTTTYLRPQNIDGKFDLQLYLTGAWYPFSWLELSPYIEFYSSHFDTPSQKVRWKYWRAGGTVTGLFDRWDVSVAVNSPTRQYDGDLLSRGSWQFSGTVQYKVKHWSLGAKYSYWGQNDYTLAELDDFYYYKGRHVPRLKKMVSVSATYNFSIGRSRRHGNKVLEESGNDTGLGKYNSVQMDQ